MSRQPFRLIPIVVLALLGSAATDGFANEPTTGGSSRTDAPRGVPQSGTATPARPVSPQNNSSGKLPDRTAPPSDLGLEDEGPSGCRYRGRKLDLIV